MNRLRGYVTSVMHPEGFHGNAALSGSRTSSYFEGWYVKLVSADRSQRWAVIPGVFLSEGGLGTAGPHEAFVQVLDGITGRSWYHRYDVEQFFAATDRWDVQVGPNTFGPGGIHLELPSLSGDVTFTSHMQPWPVSWRSPGIMGPYAWVQAMECYHGVVSFDHGLAGRLQTESGDADFAGGTGYVEKDWGEAFPVGYVWMQTNHFDRPGMSLCASTAIIPWRKSSFRGFIVGLHVPQIGREPRLHVFATHSGAKTTRLEIDDEHVRWDLLGRRGARLELTAERTLDGSRPAAGLLHAPVRSEMHKRVEETLDATVHVRLTTAEGEVVEDTGRCAGLEVHGDLERLLRER